MPTAVLPPGLEALLKAARAPSFESPYPGLEGISPEEMAIAGMPEVSDIMLKREAMAGQRAGMGGQHALGLSGLAEQSIARQIADSLSQQRLGLGFGELASRSQLGNRGLDVQESELGLKGEMAQMADLIQRAKLGIEAQRVSQEGALGEGELAMRGRALEQQLMPNLLRSMGQYEQGRGMGEFASSRAAELLKSLGGAPTAAPAQAESGSNGVLNALIAAGVLYGGYRGGKHLLGKFGKGAAQVAANPVEAAVSAAPKAAATEAEVIAQELGGGTPSMTGVLEDSPGFIMGEGATTSAPVWMRGAHQTPNPIDEVLERVMGARQSVGPRAPMGSGPRQFGPPATIGGGPMALPEETKQLLVAKILEHATQGQYVDPHVARWLEQFAH